MFSGSAFYSAVPAKIIVLAVLVVLAVLFIVLVLVSYKIRKPEALIVGDIVDDPAVSVIGYHSLKEVID